VRRRPGGLRRRKAIYHAMPRLKCLSALASIKCQIAIFGLTNRRHHHATNSLLRTIGTFQWPISHIRQPEQDDPISRHTDEQAAARSAFGGLTASGSHTFAIYILLIGQLQPHFQFLMGLGWDDVRLPNPVRPVMRSISK
jgi:hypothetical protein